MKETAATPARRAGELGDAGQAAVIDGDDPSAMRRAQHMRVGCDRRHAHAALRVANGLEFRPCRAAVEYRARQRDALAGGGLAAEFERDTLNLRRASGHDLLADLG